MPIVARRYSTRRGQSQRNVMLTEPEALEVIAKAGPPRPPGSPPPGRKPAISVQLAQVYANARICLECPELQRLRCGTGYCTIGPKPRTYLTLISIIQDAACPIGKHTKE